ncbi:MULTISPECIES: phosphatase PAP2 family protein [Streptococcus]|jgi:PAP2 superfamily protein|uniref:Phosphatase PAP2 family protein n=1 Tax=Streptococcus koreensis TaxID=2382163 RepID=A0ABN5PUL7_9STRE|nr:phosphatase PAP2 family protein [Streptococcus koreensis]AYF94027.1 phosphatase PAP2 family protein [Streptococcus koreensis]
MKKECLFYERVRPFFVTHPYYLSLLKWTNRLVTLLMPLLYFYVLWAAYLKASKTWIVLAYLLVPATGFIVLSVIRKRMNWPRPYELGTFPPLLNREGKGSSMPSRHVFSAAIISTVAWGVHPLLSVLGLSLALLLAGVRVLAGVHFVRDVVVGFLSAILWGFFWFYPLGLF